MPSEFGLAARLFAKDAAKNPGKTLRAAAGHGWNRLGQATSAANQRFEAGTPNTAQFYARELFPPTGVVSTLGDAYDYQQAGRPGAAVATAALGLSPYAGPAKRIVSPVLGEGIKHVGKARQAYRNLTRGAAANTAVGMNTDPPRPAHRTIRSAMQR